MQMIERKWLGDKTGQGCYKRVGKRTKRFKFSIGKRSNTIPPPSRVFPNRERARQIETLAERLRALVAAQDAPARFLWQVLSD